MLRLRIKEVATERGFSMMKLSQRSEVSYPILQAIWKNPYRSITLDTLQRIANTLGVPALTLLEEVTEDQANAEKEQNP